MSDNLTAEQRRKAMQANRSTGGKTTEWALRSRLVSSGISGWLINCKDLPGSPDFVFREKRLVIFVDGCFWHGCELHRTIPATNSRMWAAKIERNRSRDREVNAKLTKLGWRVVRIWEHELDRDPDDVLDIIRSKLEDLT